MADANYQAWVEVLPDFKNFNNQTITGATSGLGAAGAAGAGAFGTSFVGGLGKYTPALVAGVAALGIGQLIGNAIGSGINFSLNAIDLAGGLAEQQNAVRVAFGDMADEVLALGKSAPSSLNLTQAAFAKLATRFSSFAKTVAGDGGDVSEIIDTLTTRGADFASVYDLEASQALDVFGAALRGEADPIEAFGVNMSAAAVNAYAYANGIAEAGKELTEAEKVQARYGLLLQETAAVQGDLINTSGSYANLQREFATALEEAQTKFGEALLPVATDVLSWANTEFLPMLEPVLAEVGPQISESITEVLPQIKELLQSAGNALPDAIRIGMDSLSGDAQVLSEAIQISQGDFTPILEANQWLETYRGNVNDFFNMIGQEAPYAAEAWEKYASATDAALNASEHDFSDYNNSIQNELNELGSAAPGLGAAVSSGLAAGIANNESLAIEAASTLAFNALRAAKNALQIASPSKAFAELGAYSAEGFALGISSGATGVSSAINSMLDLPGIVGGDLTGSQSRAIYVQNPFTGEYLLAQVDDRAELAVANQEYANDASLIGGVAR